MWKLQGLYRDCPLFYSNSKIPTLVNPIAIGEHDFRRAYHHASQKSSCINLRHSLSFTPRRFSNAFLSHLTSSTMVATMDVCARIILQERTFCSGVHFFRNHFSSGKATFFPGEISRWWPKIACVQGPGHFG